MLKFRYAIFALLLWATPFVAYAQDANQVPSLATFRANAYGGTVWLGGYVTPGDGGQGYFLPNGKQSVTHCVDNGSTVIVDKNGTCWDRQSWGGVPVGTPSMVTVPTIAALENIGASAGASVTAAYVPGIGIYQWNATSTATPDPTDTPQTIVQVTGVTTGRMVLQNGAVGNVANIAALEALPDAPIGMTVNVGGTQGGTFTVTSGSIIASNCTGGDGGTTFGVSDSASAGTCYTDRYWKRQFNGAVYLSWFSGNLSGDVNIPLQNCEDAAKNYPTGVCQLPAGTFTDCEGTSAPNNITINGMGKGYTYLEKCPTTTASLITFITPNNDFVTNMSLVGTNNYLTDNPGGLVWFNIQGPSKNFGVKNIDVSNDGYGGGWISAYNYSSSPAYDFYVDNLTGTTQSGDCINLTNISYSCDIISMYGSINNAAGTINDIYINRPNVDTSYMKRLVAVWDGDNNVYITDPVDIVSNNQVGSDAGGYCLMVYNHGTGPHQTNIWIKHPVLQGCESLGIYLQGAREVHVIDPNISDVLDTADTTLPKGGIAFNGSDGTLDGGILTNNYGGVFVEPDNDPSSQTSGSVIISHTTVRSTAANGYAYKLVDATAGYPTGDIILNDDIGYDTGTNSRGVWIYYSNGAPFAGIYLNGGAYEGAYTSLEETASAGTFTASRVVVKNAAFSGAVSNAVLQLSGFGAVPLYMSNDTVDATGITAGTAVLLNGATDVNINGLTISNYSGTGYPWLASGTEGSISNVQFQNITGGTISGTGTALPTWSAIQGTFIQNLTPSQAGTAGSQYVVTGWINGSGTNWYPLRSLTGN